MVIQSRFANVLSGSSAADVPLVVAFTGLPARGKSYMAKKLVTFLTWRGFSVKIFNAGDYRRKYEGAGQSADYFATDNHEAAAERESLARMAFQDLLSWVEKGGEVALFDATNSTVRRRCVLSQLCCEYGLAPPLFIESIVNDPVLLERNYKLKLGNDDYKNTDPEKALKDFKLRVAEYEKRYETLGAVEWEESMSYIKVCHKQNGRKIIVNNCNGWLNAQILAILQNFHITPRRIFLTRPAEIYPVKDKKRVCLSQNGKRYAEEIVNFIRSKQSMSYSPEEGKFREDEEAMRPITLICSGLESSVQTLEPTIKHFASIAEMRRKRAFSGIEVSLQSSGSNASSSVDSRDRLKKQMDVTQTVCFAALNPINTGFYPLGHSHSEMMKEHAIANQDKLSVRFPGGESYNDVIQRLNPCVLELERQETDIFVVTHTVPIRLILAYFDQQHAKTTVNRHIPVNTVIEIQPNAFGSEVIEHKLC